MHVRRDNAQTEYAAVQFAMNPQGLRHVLMVHAGLQDTAHPSAHCCSCSSQPLRRPLICQPSARSQHNLSSGPPSSPDSPCCGHPRCFGSQACAPRSAQSYGHAGVCLPCCFLQPDPVFARFWHDHPHSRLLHAGAPPAVPQQSLTPGNTS